MVQPKAEPPRLSLLLAKEAPVAVIIARVRAKLFHVMKWEYEKDVFEHGSWFKGTIHQESSDVSFDGRHLVYFALNPKSGTFSWTAVCEPPFLKALAFWKHVSTWYGGGFFPDKRTLWLSMPRDTPMDNRMRHVPSRNIEKLYRLLYNEDLVTGKPPLDHRRARDGWIPTIGFPSGRSLERVSPDGKHRLRLTCDDPSDPKSPRNLLVQSGGLLNDVRTIDENVSWAEWDTTGHLIVAKQGAIRRLDVANPERAIQAIDLSGLEPPKKAEEMEEGAPR